MSTIAFDGSTGGKRYLSQAGATSASPVAPAIRDMRQPKLACRRMADADIDAAVTLLAKGFPEREPMYWRQGLDRLQRRVVPDGWPRYGYVLTDHEKLVGIILIIFAQSDTDEIRGNVSSWYVEAAYRSYSHMLLAAPLKLKGTTLFNISPAPETIETIVAQGFSRYVNGTFVSLPAAMSPVARSQVRQVEAGPRTMPPLLREHAAWGCLSFEVIHAGEAHPFVFIKRRILGGLVPSAQLIYCRDVTDFVRFAGALGRHLLRHGIAPVLIDANGPIDGLIGTYRQGRSQKFSRGAATPRLGDLSHTELAIFGS